MKTSGSFSHIYLHILTAAFWFILLGFSGTSLLCQSLTGTISGIVSDSSDARVPAAKISIRNNATNETREAESDDSGTFSIPSLAPGRYEVIIEKSGFEKSIVTGLQVTPGASTRVDVKVRIGTANQSVSVSADTAAIQTDSAEVRGVLDNQQLASLPIPANRNYQSALILIPGINPPANQHSVASNPGRGLAFQSNGSFGNTNAIRIDGATANNVFLPHVAAYSPGLESIDSVSVVNNSYDAQQGLAGGASVNVHIKTGTNSIHGSTFWYHTDNKLAANPYFVHTANPKNVDNFYGATIGGPILKNRLFLFFSYEGHYISQNSSVLTTVPTDAMRNGDFSASANNIYDPDTGDPSTGAGKISFAGKLIPAARISSISQAIQTHIPHATLPGITSNYLAIGRYTNSSTKFDSNVNWKVSSKASITARLGALTYNNFDAAAYGDNGTAVSSAGGRIGTSFGNVWSGTLSGVYVFRPNFVFDGYFAATALPTHGAPLLVDQNIGLQLGIPGTNGPTRLYGGWPNFNISNFSLVGNNASPLDWLDQEYQAQPNFTWTHGGHTVRFGVHASRQIIRHAQPQNPGAGTFNITGNGTVVNAAGAPGANAYNSWADFLLGRYSTSLTERLPYGELVGKTFIYSAFAQDLWTASNRVTVSYGLRWDYFPVGGRDGRGFVNFDPTTGNVILCGVGGNPHDCGYQMSKVNFSPSLGFSVKLSNTLVVRAGAGLNRDPYPLAFERDLVQNFPDDIQASQTSPSSFVASNTFAQGLAPVAPVDISTGKVSLIGTSPYLAYTINYLPNKPKRDYVETWNLSLEKQFWGGILAAGRYVGSRQLQISSVFNTNAGLVGGGAASQPFNTTAFKRTAATNIITPIGRNQYDAFQATVARQFRSGYSVNVGYTFSKNFAYCCDTTAGETVSIQAPGYTNLNRALAGFDRPYVLTISSTGQLPFGKGKLFLNSGVGAAIAGGWRLSGIYQSYSGTPFTISASANALNAPGSSQIADRVRSGNCRAGGGKLTGTSYVNASCFAAVTTARFGNAGFNSVRGPGVNVLNASLQRRIDVFDRLHVEIKADAFNLTNTPHFANPTNTNISNVTFNTDHSVANLNGFGAFTGVNSRDQEGVDQRYLRLGLRLEF